MNDKVTEKFKCVFFLLFRNVLSSQEVVDFVLERIGQQAANGEVYELSEICEEVNLLYRVGNPSQI